MRALLFHNYSAAALRSIPKMASVMLISPTEDKTEQLRIDPLNGRGICILYEVFVYSRRIYHFVVFGRGQRIVAK